MLPKSCMCCCKHTQLMLNQDILLSWIELSADIFDGLSLNGYRVAHVYTIPTYIHMYTYIYLNDFLGCYHLGDLAKLLARN